MWKIKHSIVKVLTEKRITRSEFLVLWCIARWQSESGRIRKVQRRKVCRIIHISKSSFYNAVDGLKDKGILFTIPRHKNAMDIQILDNDFRDKDFSCGYFTLDLKIFEDPEFQKLKAREILLILDLLKNCMAGKRAFLIGSKKFFEKYTKLLGVTERTLRGYLKSIKAFFHVKLHQGIYSFLAIAKKVYTKRTGAISPGEAEVYREHVISSICDQEKIRTYKPKDFRDVKTLLSQYRKRVREDKLEEHLADAIKRSLEVINKNRKKKSEWQYELNPKLIHKLLRENLSL